MLEINQPYIGEHVRTSRDYVYSSDGKKKYSLLFLDGSSFPSYQRPILAAALGSNVLENRDSGDPRIPYKIVADLVL